MNAQDPLAPLYEGRMNAQDPITFIMQLNVPYSSKAKLISLYSMFPVKYLYQERKKLIINALKNYPNGIPVDENGEPIIFLM